MTPAKVIPLREDIGRIATRDTNSYFVAVASVPMSKRSWCKLNTPMDSVSRFGWNQRKRPSSPKP